MKKVKFTTWTVGQDAPMEICHFLQQQADAGIKFFCFDYFDTLITRNLEPEYSKQLAARLHTRLLSHLLPPEQLYTLRQQLERELCEKSAASGGELEFYLQDFAQPYRLLLQKKIGNIQPLEDASRFSKIILAVETAVEQAVQQPCEETLQVLAWLREQGMNTVLISDFYLPGPSFNTMLENMGLQDQFDHIYISADHGLSKGSGRLYEKISQDLGCPAEQMLMIGDNAHSDVLRAKEKGLQAIQVVN
ncbi:MAG: HAD family hydrolase, partial [Candidatus Electrothrix sp. AR3]|nr:HAD family hydrolase [Candidatus Electrothrix sp. AR3]